jgi:release factor glutamine methyltransferase
MSPNAAPPRAAGRDDHRRRRSARREGVAEGIADGEPLAKDAMTAPEVVAGVAARLAAAGIESARFEAWLLLAAATGRARAELMAGAAATLEPGQTARLDELVRRRLAREPIAYILGEKEFWSLTFDVGPAVLIPRPETETVVQAVLDEIGDRTAALRILDLGSGSGCLLLALLSELPEATGLGIDHSAAALEVAKRNAKRLGLADRSRFRAGDWGGSLEELFDLIVSNPPYVTENAWTSLQAEIREFEPKAALVGGADGLAAYRALAPDCARLLARDGLCALEIGYGQSDAVSRILSDHALAVDARYNDLAGIERCLIVRHGASTPGAR